MIRQKKIEKKPMWTFIKGKNKEKKIENRNEKLVIYSILVEICETNLKITKNLNSKNTGTFWICQQNSSGNLKL